MQPNNISKIAVEETTPTTDIPSATGDNWSLLYWDEALISLNRNQ